MSDQNLDYLHPQLRPLAVRVDSLTPDPRNARRRDQRAIDALKASIRSKGFRSAIVVQKTDDGELIIRAGNGRHQAMVELGYEYIPALVFEEGDEDAIAFAIADNRTAELAEWDFEVLSEHLSYLENNSDLSALGWTDEERESLTLFTLDGLEDAPVKTTSSDAVDPDDIDDYEPEQDTFLIKIEKVPPGAKDEVVALLNAALMEGGYSALKARAY